MLTLLITLAVLAGIAALCLFLVALVLAGGVAWVEGDEEVKSLRAWLDEVEQ